MNFKILLLNSFRIIKGFKRSNLIISLIIIKIYLFYFLKNRNIITYKIEGYFTSR